MTDNLDAFVENLQAQIFEEARESLGELGFERWRNPLYAGKMADPDAYARVTGPCGDTMEMFLRLDNGRVGTASFFTDGCASSTVCGSLAAEMAVGKDPDEIGDITGEAILAKLGKFPKEDEHCAFLAAETINEAVHNYMMQQVKK